MDLIVLLRTAEAVVWAWVSAAPHRTVEEKKLALVMKTGAGEGKSRLHLRGCAGHGTQFNSRVQRSRLAQGDPFNCKWRRQIGGRSLVSWSGGERISVSRRRVARLLQQGRHIGEQSIRVNPRTGRSTAKDHQPAPVHSFSGESASNIATPVHPGFPPHGTPDPAWCQIPPSAHALHRAAGRT
jgi:hypothetical protein